MTQTTNDCTSISKKMFCRGITPLKMFCVLIVCQWLIEFVGRHLKIRTNELPPLKRRILQTVICNWSTFFESQFSTAKTTQKCSYDRSSWSISRFHVYATLMDGSQKFPMASSKLISGLNTMYGRRLTSLFHVPRATRRASGSILRASAIGLQNSSQWNKDFAGLGGLNFF